MGGYTRRQLLSATAGTAILGSIAGCVTPSGSGDGSGEATVQASFFVFGDFASQVAGDVATAEVLVPTGQHGHGWEPGPRVREAIRNADVFVHGMLGFQPWTDDVLGDLRQDGGQAVTVDVSDGISLLEVGGGHGRDHGAGQDHEDGEHDDEHVKEGRDGEHSEERQEGGHDEEDGDEHSEEGRDDGDGGEHSDDWEEGHGHGEGGDPHFWTDPLRTKEAVDNVRQGLVDADPDNAGVYAENAGDYRDRLDGLHDRIESTVETASNDVLLLAGHDAFRYFGDRYGVRIEALTGASPDDRPTPRDIERAQHAIEEHGLTYVCADPLESQEAAEQLVEETDAEAVLPLTAMPGLRDDWAEDGWGYLDIMANVNLPTLERALDA